MKKHTITTYSFDELSPEAQDKAVANLGDTNVDYDWWDSIYYDAAQIGLKITGFNIDRGNSIDGELTEYASKVIKLILENHGDGTATYQLAKEYQPKFKTVENDGEYAEYDDDQAELVADFERELKEEYLSMLKEGYDYLTTREAIVETIEVNEYEFTKNGDLS